MRYINLRLTLTSTFDIVDNCRGFRAFTAVSSYPLINDTRVYPCVALKQAADWNSPGKKRRSTSDN